jgi:glycerol-3-phosphate dehydrogenase
MISRRVCSCRLLANVRHRGVERDSDTVLKGTSSKSTKLVHGGVRYLQKAIFELDYEQYKLVREALHERKTFLHTAPYLSIMQPIMLPVYKSVRLAVLL